MGEIYSRTEDGQNHAPPPVNGFNGNGQFTMTNQGQHSRNPQNSQDFSMSSHSQNISNHDPPPVIRPLVQGGNNNHPNLVSRASPSRNIPRTGHDVNSNENNHNRRPQIITSRESMQHHSPKRPRLHGGVVARQDVHHTEHDSNRLPPVSMYQIPKPTAYLPPSSSAHPSSTQKKQLNPVGISIRDHDRPDQLPSNVVSLESTGYQPQVEAISPAPEDVRLDSNLLREKEEIGSKLCTVEKEINHCEERRRRLLQLQEQLKERAGNSHLQSGGATNSTTSAAPTTHSVTPTKSDTASPHSVERIKTTDDASKSVPKPDFIDLTNGFEDLNFHSKDFNSIVQDVLSENRQRAKEQHNQLLRLCSPLPSAATAATSTNLSKTQETFFSGNPYVPLYKQPSDVPGIIDEIRYYQEEFKPRLQNKLRHRVKAECARLEYLSEQYKNQSLTWCKKVDKVNNSTKRRQKEIRMRDYFEKVLPELRKNREDREKAIIVAEELAVNGTIPTSTSVAHRMILSNSNDCSQLSEERYSTRGTMNNYPSSTTGSGDEEIIPFDPVKEKQRLREQAIDPPPTIPPWERRYKFLDFNGLTRDPKLLHRMDQDMVSYWGREEAEIFRQAYAMYGKNFHFIAKCLPRKRVQDCIQYYYLTKATAQYKLLVKKQNRRRGKAAAAAGGGNGGNLTLSNITIGNTSTTCVSSYRVGPPATVSRELNPPLGNGDSKLTQEVSSSEIVSNLPEDKSIPGVDGISIDLSQSLALKQSTGPAHNPLHEEVSSADEEDVISPKKEPEIVAVTPTPASNSQMETSVVDEQSSPCIKDIIHMVIDRTLTQSWIAPTEENVETPAKPNVPRRPSYDSGVQAVPTSTSIQEKSNSDHHSPIRPFMGSSTGAFHNANASRVNRSASPVRETTSSSAAVAATIQSGNAPTQQIPPVTCSIEVRSPHSVAGPSMPSNAVMAAAAMQQAAMQQAAALYAHHQKFAAMASLQQQQQQQQNHMGTYPGPPHISIPQAVLNATSNSVNPAVASSLDSNNCSVSGAGGFPSSHHPLLSHTAAAAMRYQLASQNHPYMHPAYSQANALGPLSVASTSMAALDIPSSTLYATNSLLRSGNIMSQHPGTNLTSSGRIAPTSYPHSINTYSRNLISQSASGMPTLTPNKQQQQQIISGVPPSPASSSTSPPGPPLASTNKAILDCDFFTAQQIHAPSSSSTNNKTSPTSTNPAKILNRPPILGKEDLHVTPQATSHSGLSGKVDITRIHRQAIHPSALPTACKPTPVVATSPGMISSSNNNPQRLPSTIVGSNTNTLSPSLKIELPSHIETKEHAVQQYVDDAAHQRYMEEIGNYQLFRNRSDSQRTRTSSEASQCVDVAKLARRKNAELSAYVAETNNSNKQSSSANEGTKVSTASHPNASVKHDMPPPLANYAASRGSRGGFLSTGPNQSPGNAGGGGTSSQQDYDVAIMNAIESGMPPSSSATGMIPPRRHGIVLSGPEAFRKRGYTDSGLNLRSNTPVADTSPDSGNPVSSSSATLAANKPPGAQNVSSSENSNNNPPTSSNTSLSVGSYYRPSPLLRHHQSKSGTHTPSGVTQTTTAATTTTSSSSTTTSSFPMTEGMAAALMAATVSNGRHHHSLVGSGVGPKLSGDSPAEIYRGFTTASIIDAIIDKHITEANDDDFMEKNEMEFASGSSQKVISIDNSNNQLSRKRPIGRRSRLDCDDSERSLGAKIEKYIEQATSNTPSSSPLPKKRTLQVSSPKATPPVPFVERPAHSSESSLRPSGDGITAVTGVTGSLTTTDHQSTTSQDSSNVARVPQRHPKKEFIRSTSQTTEMVEVNNVSIASLQPVTPSLPPLSTPSLPTEKTSPSPAAAASPKKKYLSRIENDETNSVSNTNPSITPLPPVESASCEHETNQNKEAEKEITDQPETAVASSLDLTTSTPPLSSPPPQPPQTISSSISKISGSPDAEFVASSSSVAPRENHIPLKKRNRLPPPLPSPKQSSSGASSPFHEGGLQIDLESDTHSEQDENSDITSAGHHHDEHQEPVQSNDAASPCLNNANDAPISPISCTPPVSPPPPPPSTS